MFGKRMERGAEADATARLTALYDRFGERVFRFINAMTGDPELARELTQDTFLKLAARLRRDPRPPGAPYVFRAARNTVYSRLRHLKIERRCIDPHDDGARAASDRRDPGRDLERSELRRGLAAALADLPAGHRAVFLLSEQEGLSYDEIAAVLGVPPGTIASRKHTAVRSLRRSLKERGHAL